MTSPALKVLYSLLCDDIRREDNGKLIIIGLYGADVVLPVAPVALRFDYLLALRADAPGDAEAKVRVIHNGRPIFAATGKMHFADQQQVALNALKGIVVQVEKDCALDFQLSLNGGRFRSVLKVPVKVTAPSAPIA